MKLIRWIDRRKILVKAIDAVFVITIQLASSCCGPKSVGHWFWGGTTGITIPIP